jgi:hypothetical protein
MHEAAAQRSGYGYAADAAFGRSKARGLLHDKGRPEMVQEIIAKRIIEVAASGVRDPDELARRALQALGMSEN